MKSTTSMERQMSNTAVIHEEAGAVRSRLAELGIPSEALLREAVAQGELIRSGFAKNVPAMAVGCAGWGVTVGGLRTGLKPHGWIASSEGRLETTFNPMTMVAVAVTAGDEATGRRGFGDPKTRYQKGVATIDAIDRNNKQLSLLSRLDPSHPDYEAGFKPDIAPVIEAKLDDADDVEEPSGVMLWVLLTFKTADEIRCELSLPYGVGVDGVVHSWAERILLGPISLDGPSKVEVVPVEPTPELDVRVTRRSEKG